MKRGNFIGAEALLGVFACVCRQRPGPDLPIGYIGLSLGRQDPRGPPINCGTHQWPIFKVFKVFSEHLEMKKKI